MRAGFYAEEMKQSEVGPGSRGAPKAAGLAALCPSQNFGFLGYHDHRLPEVATRAECALALDPVGALTHLRLFGEGRRSRRAAASTASTRSSRAS